MPWVYCARCKTVVEVKEKPTGPNSMITAQGVFPVVRKCELHEEGN